MYEPAEDSYLLVDAIRLVCRSFKPKGSLDMGTGSGIIALELAKISKQVVAADIDAECVSSLEGVVPENVVILKSDLFEAFKEHKFDLITFNPPYLPVGEDDSPDIALDGGPTGIELTVRFLEQAVGHLNKGGRILFIASSLADIAGLENHAKKIFKKMRIVMEKKLPFETLFVYEVRDG